MSRYSRESIKTSNETMNYLILFSEQHSLNRSAVKFSQFCLFELTDVAKYGCMGAQQNWTSRYTNELSGQK